MTIYEVMRHIKNYFPDADNAIAGELTISDGTLTGHDLTGYVLIEGSRYNDGVYELPTNELHDETFHGRVTPLCPPSDFLLLCKEISEWEEKNGAATVGPFQSESFGGYSYTRATNQDGMAITWQDVFKRRLNAWRKI